MSTPHNKINSIILSKKQNPYPDVDFRKSASDKMGNQRSALSQFTEIKAQLRAPRYLKRKLQDPKLAGDDWGFCYVSFFFFF